MMGIFFRLDRSSGPMWSGTSAGLAPHLLWKQWWRFAVSRVSLVTVMELVLRWNGGEKRKQWYHHYWWCCINLLRYWYFCNNMYLSSQTQPKVWPVPWLLWFLRRGRLPGLWTTWWSNWWAQFNQFDWQVVKNPASLWCWPTTTLLTMRRSQLTRREPLKRFQYRSG